MVDRTRTGDCPEVIDNDRLSQEIDGKKRQLIESIQQERERATTATRRNVDGDGDRRRLRVVSRRESVGQDQHQVLDSHRQTNMLRETVHGKT